MESQPIKGATYAIASAFRLVSAFQYITIHHRTPTPDFHDSHFC